MANGFDKLNVKSAVKSRNKFDLSRTHLTTMDFGQIVPLFCEETVPGDKFNVNATYFSRMAPLVKPTYGKFYFKTMETFVPYYQVCDGIDAWLAGDSTFEGDTTHSRYTTYAEILNLFVSNNELTTAVTSADTESGAWYDIKYYDSANTVSYRKFTDLGRYYNKVLNSLGYVIPENCKTNPSSSTWPLNKLSALPLLAFAKAYNDWMSQSQRYNTSRLTKLLKDVKHNITHTYAGQTLYNSSTQVLSYWGIMAILDAVRLCYENDYFTSAWQSSNSPLNGFPYSPEGNPLAILHIQNIPGDNGSIKGTNSADIYLPENYYELEVAEDSGGAVEGFIDTSITQRGLDWLKSFDDWVRRNNYSGSRAVQKIYSRFGIKTEDYKSNYAHLIDKDTLPIQVGDVTALAQDFVSSASTNNVELGDYAGKGIMSGNGSFSFEAQDYGMLFVLGWYTVDPMNVYGYDRTVLRTAPIDYYTAEFDGVGPEAISQQEVFVNSRVTNNVVPTAVFGFTERYNSYRFGKDRITGDFRKLTRESGSTYSTTGTEMNTWHSGRMLTDLRQNGTLVAQNPAFNTLSQTDSEYNRIFSVTDGSVDHFYMTAQFNVTAVRPMLSLNQVPRLGEGDTVVSRNGNEVS